MKGDSGWERGYKATKNTKIQALSDENYNRNSLKNNRYTITPITTIRSRENIR